MSLVQQTAKKKPLVGTLTKPETIYGSFTLGMLFIFEQLSLGKVDSKTLIINMGV